MGVEEEELVPTDDRVIGRALRWSAIVVFSIAAVVVAVVLWNREPEKQQRVRKKDPGAISNLRTELEPIPEVAFRDVTKEAGITFRHTSGARGEKLLPECMGAGAAFLDYDSDGDPDLLLVNGRDWPHVASDARPTQALFRNDGRGAFTDVTSEAGLDVTVVGMGVAVADYDADGDPDVYLTAVGRNLLFRNDGGTFVDVTAEAGVAGDEVWSSSAGFFDCDADGDLDLFVCNYVQWSPKIDSELAFSLNGTDRAYGPPLNYGGTQPFLFRNEGGGRFREVAKQSGLHIVNRATGVPVAKSLAVTFDDHDGDGDLDIYVANDTTRNFVYRNAGGGRFEEVGEKLGFAYDGEGSATGAMGIDIAHYRNDRNRAIAVANFANEMTSLYVTQPGSEFLADEAIVEGIGSPSRQRLSFGLFFFDYDLDGRLDLFQANGHLEEEIHEVQKSQTYRQPPQLFWNRGPEANACFVEVPSDKGTADLHEPIVGRGAAFADVDGDGDLDVLLTQTGGAPKLLRNDQKLGHHWVRIRLRDPGPNRDAIGAAVELVAGGVTQRRRIMPTRSYLSQVEPCCTFGLGKAKTIERVRIVWPDGKTQDVAPASVAIDRVTTVRR